MSRRPPVAFGGAIYLAGLAGAVALLAQRPFGTVTGVVVGGLCLGLVAGGAVVTRAQAMDTLAGRTGRTVTGLPVLSIGVWTTWTGLQTGAGSRYLFTIAGVFVAVIGWAVLAQGSQTVGGGRAEMVATLPRTNLRGVVGTEGRRRWLGPLVTTLQFTVIGSLTWLAITQSILYSGLFAGLLFAVFLPGTKAGARLTETGLLTRRYIVWMVPIGQSCIAWEEIYGYEATADRLRIATTRGPDVTYNPDRIDDLDHVIEVLDDHVPRL